MDWQMSESYITGPESEDTADGGYLSRGDWSLEPLESRFHEAPDSEGDDD